MQASNNEKAMEGLESFLPGFLKDRISDYEQLQSAFEKRAYDDIKKIAHRLKGFCDPYGFGTLTTISLKLEDECEKSEVNDENVEDLLKEAKEYLERKGKEIEG